MKKKLAKLSLVTTALVCAFIVSRAANAQNGAVWLGGSGNWSNSLEWNCFIPGTPINPSPCVPNGTTFGVTATSGTIDVDIGVNVQSADLSANLILNGTSLAATQELTLGGSLQLNSATVTGPAGWSPFLSGSSSFNASQLNNLGSLTTTGQLSVSNMTLSAPGGIEVDGGLQLTGATIDTGTNDLNLAGGSSSFGTSTASVGNSVLLDGTLVTGNAKVTSQADMIGNLGTGVLNAANTTLNADLVVLGQNPSANGQLTLGTQATLNLGNVGSVLGASGTILVGDTGQGTLTVQGGTINSLAPSLISIGTNPSGPGNGQMSIVQGGQVNVTSVLVGFGGTGTAATLTVDGSGSQLNLSGASRPIFRSAEGP